jgi:hypothetical protein
MSDEHKHRNIHVGSHLAGAIWFMGWLFTIGFAKLLWWQMILGIVVWPYFMGAFLSKPGL